MPKLSLDELIIAFDKDPDDAIEYFKNLGIEPSENWKDTLDAVLKDSFAIAGLTNIEMIMTAKDLIEKAITENTDFKEFKNILKNELGIWRDWHADLVVRQNVSNAQSAGTLNRQLSAKDFLQIISFHLGGRKNHTEGCLHLANTNICVRLDDKNLKKVYPPRHFRCGTEVRSRPLKWAERNNYKIVAISDIPSKFYNAKGFDKLPNKPLMERIDVTNYPAELINQIK